MGLYKGCFYADFDESTNCWCVFHTDLFDGKAFGTYAAEFQAEKRAEELNRQYY
jgi:hypothetical protein